MRHAPLLVAALLAVAATASPAQAKDEDVATMLRQAIVAQDVDKDPKRARELLERIWSLAPQSESGLHAALRLAPLMKDKARRLGLLVDVTKRHTTRMSEAVKHQVHDAMAQLLKPGDFVKTPLGNLLVAPEPTHLVASPVEAKIARIIKSHHVRGLPFQSNTEAAFRDLERELKPLGEAGKLVLVRMVDEGHPDEAFSAGILLRRSDPLIALRGYARAIRTGRVQFRGQVVRAASKFATGPITSPNLIEMFLPLLEVDHVQEVHDSLIRLIAIHMSDKQLLAHASSAKQYREQWFARTIDRRLTEAFVLLIEEAAEISDPDWRADLLFHAVANRPRIDGAFRYVFDLGKLDEEVLASLFRVLVERCLVKGTSGSNEAWKRLGRALSKKPRWATLRRDLFSRAFRADEQGRDVLTSVIYWSHDRENPGVTPESLFQTEADWDRLAEQLPTLPTVLRAPWMQKNEKLWRRAIERLRVTDLEARLPLDKKLREVLGNRAPESLSKFCMEFVLAQDHSNPKGTGTPQWIWTAAGWAKDPRLLELVWKHRKALQGNTYTHGALTMYERAGGEIVPFAIRLADAPLPGFRRWVLSTLFRAHEDPVAWAYVRALPKTRDNVLAMLTNLDARAPNHRELLVEIYEWAATESGVFENPQKLGYLRTQLAVKAKTYRIREAIPFLVRAYEAAPHEHERKIVMDAMDTIRDHHERLAFFRSWGQDDPGERKVISLLDDEDPAIRRAAVLSLATLQGPRALPRLLEIAKNDKNESVRKAALESVDRVATAVKPTGEAATK